MLLILITDDFIVIGIEGFGYRSKQNGVSIPL